MTAKEKLALYVATFCAEKQTKIASSPYAFFRGTAQLFYARLFASHARHDRERPLVLSNGDVHPQNFGVVPLSDEPRGRRLHIAINDFDEACHAPFSVDVKRCATGFALLAAQCALKKSTADDAIETFVTAYVDEAKKLAADRKRIDKLLDATHAKGAALDLLEDASANGAKRFLDHAVVGDALKPSVHLLPAPRAKAPMQRALSALREGIVVKDVAHRYGSGTASAGLPRWYVLADVPDGSRPARVVLEVKIGTPSTLRTFVDTAPLAKEPGEAAARAQRQLALAWARSIELDDDVAVAHPHHDRHAHTSAHAPIDRDSFLVRERCPAKATVHDDDLSASELASWADTCGVLLARSHARSTEGAIERVHESLARDKEKRGKSAFLDEIGTFAVACAEHIERDHDAIAHEIRAHH